MKSTEIRKTEEFSDLEWQTRCDLAAVYHMLHHLRMTDLIYTHMSARVPGEDGTFLINHYGEMFDEITASSLVKMDYDGNVLSENGRYNEAGFTIHSGVYKARPDINCVLHTHTMAGIAVSITADGLLPLSQDAAVILDDVAYHDYGVPASVEECKALGRSCQGANCIILRNHGLLTLGTALPAAFTRMYTLEHACAEQVAAQSMNTQLSPISTDTLNGVRERFRGHRDEPDYGQLEWQAMLRLLERKRVDYRR